MALVVFLRGVNVGGHRRFRPSTLAAELKHLGALNIGTAGTLVIRARITRAKLRAELTRRLLLACRAGSAAVGDNDEAIADANAVATDESQAKSTQYATSNFPLP